MKVEMDFNLTCSKSIDLNEVSAKFDAISQDANFDINNIISEHTCYLITAASCCKFETVRFLLRKGANPNTVNKIGYSALHCVAFMAAIDKNQESEFVKIAKILTRYEADVQLKNHKGETPLDISRKGSASQMTEFLRNL